MAISPMAKVMIVCHRSQAAELLEALQDEGICEVLNSDEASVSRAAPELISPRKRAKDLEELIGRLDRAIAFLSEYSDEKGGLAGVLAPRKPIDRRSYERFTTGNDALVVVDEAERLQEGMEGTQGEIEHLQNTLSVLRPWASLRTPVEDVGSLRSSISWAGIVPAQKVNQLEEDLAERGAGLQIVDASDRRAACIVVALQENVDQVQKLLRSYEFELVSFESMSGTVPDLIREHEQRLDDARRRLSELEKASREMTRNLLRLQILHDYYRNRLGREQAGENVPSTQQAVILEGWCKKRNLSRLEATVGRFGAASVGVVPPAADEQPPVDIENHRFVRPFEVITELYGNPSTADVDPTVFLAPFFALFFGLCLTDAGYGLVLLALLAFLLKKMQGDRRALWMLVICAVLTVIAGALTGGWFADAIPTMLGTIAPGLAETLNQWRAAIMVFDPLAEPLIFIGLSLALGYTQILFGLLIAFINDLKRKEYGDAVFKRLVWLIFLNCIVLYIFSKTGAIPEAVGSVVGVIAIIQAVLILGFTERHSGMAGRVGGGVFALFSTVFFLGDILSYVRLMALGMVTVGLGMAVNILAQLVMEVPYVGFILGLVLFVGGHLVNIALSVLSSFVHSLRLQFVEFFPKFFVGGGREFRPLQNTYQHVMIVDGDRVEAGG